jgi:hypothetical protein
VSLKIENGFLYIEYHELAWSARTSGFPCYFLNTQGTVVGKFETEKRATRIKIPANAKYLFRWYRTNSGYPDHTLYLLKEGEPEIAAEIDKYGLTVHKSLEPLVLEFLDREMDDC